MVGEDRHGPLLLLVEVVVCDFFLRLVADRRRVELLVNFITALRHGKIAGRYLSTALSSSAF